MILNIYYSVLAPSSLQAFTGTLDGNNHKICNVKINSSEQYVGLFGYIGVDAAIINLNITNL